MLSARRKFDGQTVHAYYERKENAPFYCLDCGEPVLLKTGKNKINHFAHENLRTCDFANNESDEHRRCKMEIYNALLQTAGVEDVVLERCVGTNRPDVSAYINGVPVAIEVQISNLSIEKIMYRTIEYFRKGIHVLWLLQWTPKLDGQRYSPKIWEKWIHTLLFGRVYYWTGGLNVVSYQFESAFKTVPRKSWHSPNGVKMTGGGYSVPSKRFKAAIRGRTFNLATDFAPRHRNMWQGKDFIVPDAKIFMERYNS